jgi:hypothetical protein
MDGRECHSCEGVPLKTQEWEKRGEEDEMERRQSVVRPRNNSKKK